MFKPSEAISLVVLDLSIESLVPNFSGKDVVYCGDFCCGNGSVAYPEKRFFCS